MGLLFEEIDTQPSPIGTISLRRRRIPALGDDDIYEVKLGDEFLMSSLFVAAEEALADLGLAALDRDHLSVVVGGVGLGYTAARALRDSRVTRLTVVELLGPVIHWHQSGQVPLGPVLSNDERCRLVEGDFFARARGEHGGLDPESSGVGVDAILLDIDHSPSDWLADGNAAFYTEASLSRLAAQLRPGGVFALWSNEPPETGVQKRLSEAIGPTRAEVVTFYNPFQNREATNTVYVSAREE
ncbi:hypothetical protein C8D92_10524 [Tamilnaduibacter salinus]|uniref:Spermidine synthase n=1 Tax=Tamilnaduibacter salinus TaxID=1484056 RepID=A0A2U1CWL0_9GAMM|nr:spermidine synthase [Tamilnaduibacter salinus]PVY76271.1 hypothetical protein C8D92_10524 [Tamilnaduibacter salinus]